MWCKSTFRPALACAAMILCAGVALAQAQPHSPYRVTYDNGITLEVIAVSILPTRLKPFWDPAGTKLMERPYDSREISTVRANQAGMTNYEVVVRVSGLKENPIYLDPRPLGDAK